MQHLAIAQDACWQHPLFWIYCPHVGSGSCLWGSAQITPQAPWSVCAARPNLCPDQVPNCSVEHSPLQTGKSSEVAASSTGLSLPWLLARQPVHTHCEYSLGFSSPSTHPNSFPGSWGLPHGSAHVDLLSLTDPSQALVPSWCLFLPSYLICGDLAALVS